MQKFLEPFTSCDDKTLFRARVKLDELYALYPSTPEDAHSDSESDEEATVNDEDERRSEQEQAFAKSFLTWALKSGCKRRDLEAFTKKRQPLLIKLCMNADRLWKAYRPRQRDHIRIEWTDLKGMPSGGAHLEKRVFCGMMQDAGYTFLTPVGHDRLNKSATSHLFILARLDEME